MSIKKAHREKFFPTVGERFLHVIECLGLTQAEFARQLGTSQGWINEILKNKKKPTALLVNLISNLYAINKDWLLDGKGPMARAATDEGQKKGVAKPDFDVMREVIEAVEEIFQKENLSLPPRKKAELVCLLCEEITEGETRKESLGIRVLRLIKLAS